MMALLNLIFILTLAVSFSFASPTAILVNSKVFNYQGALQIKDDRTGAILTDSKNETTISEIAATNDSSAAEAACWQLINEQSVVTFALQRKVLDELDADIKNIEVEKDLKDAVDKLTQSMRLSMEEAEDALKRDSAEEFFDGLFKLSEDIINLSVIVRDPKMNDEVFLTLVKALSRLGRNNTIFIQEFTEMCSFIQRGPRPRSSGSD